MTSERTATAEWVLTFWALGQTKSTQNGDSVLLFLPSSLAF
jgi:hypothetical protein